MRKHIATTLLVAGTVVAAMGLAVPAAMAAVPWTVTGGPRFTASAATAFTLTDITHSADFVCPVGTAKGSVTDQTSGPSPFGSVTMSTFGDPTRECAGPLDTFGTSRQGGMIAKINGTSFSGGVTTGTFTNVDQVFSVSGFGIDCTAEVTGTAGFTYTNATHVLSFTTAGDALKAISAVGCIGIMQVGDKLTLTGSEFVTGSPTNPIQISSP